MRLSALRAALEALAKTDPLAFERPLGDPVVAGALEELERQDGRWLEYYPCPALHPERWPLAKYFDTSAELFVHLLTCDQFAAHVADSAAAATPPVSPQPLAP